MNFVKGQSIIHTGSADINHLFHKDLREGCKDSKGTDLRGGP